MIKPEINKSKSCNTNHTSYLFVGRKITRRRLFFLGGVPSFGAICLMSLLNQFLFVTSSHPGMTNHPTGTGFFFVRWEPTRVLVA